MEMVKENTERKYVIARHNSYNGKFLLWLKGEKEPLYEGHPNEILKYCMINNYDIRFE